MADIGRIAARVRRLRAAAQARDSRMGDIQKVRAGELCEIFPQFFSDDMHQSVAANFIDVATRDLAELLSPLPSLNCATGSAVTQKAKDFAAKKNNIGHWYWLSSRLSETATTACDRYLSYGFIPIVVEPDVDKDCPRIRFEDPRGSYPAFDRFGRCIAFAKVWRARVDELCDLFPDLAGAIYAAGKSFVNAGQMPGQFTTEGAEDVELEVIRFSDSDQTVVFLPQAGNTVLAAMPNPLGRCPVEVARRPGLDDELRGQFDDVIPVQMARAKMALLALEAADKSVQAPLAVPDDVQELNFGPDATIVSRNPEKIRRVGLEISPGAFAEISNLKGELHEGARYPDGRAGQMDASVITGRGVQALLGTIDTQVKTAQTQLGAALARATRMCFELDEKLWPNKKRTVWGTHNGTPFEITYTPSKDIAGNYECDVTYGFAAGLGPNQALVFLLQLRGDKLIDRDTLRRHLALNEDVVALQKAVDIEELRDAAKQGIAAYVQSIGMIAQNGGDPTAPLHALALIVEGVQKGKPIEDLLVQAFTPAAPPPPPAPGLAPPEGAPGPGGPGAPPGMSDSGLPQGVAPGQAGMAPGGQPSLQTLLAGLSSSGKPDLRAGVSRRLPA